ncbi:CGNR zinc finger domain-containing protein [Jannaschia sp. CCS1]|uniref:CGNR zinc finger domain-containing protein n=1 Tax=Jannaschia sp. (strain CCS1) TaxID=290400 RepID=UPI00140F8528|nr:CGNR zinc finger domain-containing protein [Jannaschia sp. CCS1]
MSLDLVNIATPGSRRGTPHTGGCVIEDLHDLLKDDPASVAQLGDDHVEGFVELARLLHTAIDALSNGQVATAATALNHLLRKHPATPELAQDPDGTWRLHHHPLDAELVPMWTAICAEGLAREIGHQNVRRFGICNAHRCDRVYFDTSRNGTRQYCSLACQNRVKAAAFRERRAT